MPFMPAFYSGEDTLEGLMGQFCGRIFDQLGLSHQLCRRWQGPSDARLKQVCDEGRRGLWKKSSFPSPHPLPKTFALVYGRMK